MRVIALVAAWNEERYVAGFVEHMARHGVETYLIDNESSDATAEIARSYLGRGVAGVETLPRPAGFDLGAVLGRKEELALELEADWFLHADVDEIRLPPSPGETLAEALARADRDGYNAVNFREFCFVPTREEPDHDHPRFQETMRSYYPLEPHFPYRLNAWKRRPERVDLRARGGHRVAFPGLLMSPEPFAMRHYSFLSVAHALERYGRRDYARAGVERGWHGWRRKLYDLRPDGRPEALELPSAADLRTYVSDDELDYSHPLGGQAWMRNWVRRLKGKRPDPTPSYAVR